MAFKRNINRASIVVYNQLVKPVLKPSEDVIVLEALRKIQPCSARYLHFYINVGRIKKMELSNVRRSISELKSEGKIYSDRISICPLSKRNVNIWKLKNK